MTPKEKAKELIGKFMPHVYCYMGSGMLSNDYDEKVAMDNAKKSALIAVDEILGMSYFDVTTMAEEDSLYKNYWTEVRAEIGAIK